MNIEDIKKMDKEERDALFTMLKSMGVDTTEIRKIVEERIQENTKSLLKENCVKCGTEFEYERKRGQKPKYCSDECRKPEIEKKVRTYTCDTCEQEFEMHGRGKLPKTCATCKEQPITRTYTCDVCGKEGTQVGKGPLRKRHPECKPAKEEAVRTYTCDVCGKEGIQYGIGKTRVRCDGCKPPLEKVTRTYTCRVCNNEFVQHGRGRLRTISPDCAAKLKKSPVVKESVNTESNTPVEQEIVTSDDVDGDTQKVLDLLNNLMGGN